MGGSGGALLWSHGLLMAVLAALAPSCDLYENFRLQGGQVWKIVYSQKVSAFQTMQNGYRKPCSAGPRKEKRNKKKDPAPGLHSSPHPDSARVHGGRRTILSPE